MTSAQTPPLPRSDDVMVVVSHLIEQMYDVIDGLNADIDRMVSERDRVKAAVLALSPGAPPAPVPPKASPIERVLATKPARNLTKEPRRKTGRRPANSKYDYAEVARVAVDAIARSEPTGATVAAYFGVTPAMASFLVVQARKKGFEIARKSSGGRKSKPAKLEDRSIEMRGPNPEAFDPEAITPAQIRNEVTEIPPAVELAPIEYTPDPAPIGFTGRPTHVEHEVETERNGWKPGMAAEVLGV